MFLFDRRSPAPADHLSVASGSAGIPGTPASRGGTPAVPSGGIRRARRSAGQQGSRRRRARHRGGAVCPRRRQDRVDQGFRDALAAPLGGDPHRFELVLPRGPSRHRSDHPHRRPPGPSQEPRAAGEPLPPELHRLRPLTVQSGPEGIRVGRECAQPRLPQSVQFTVDHSPHQDPGTHDEREKRSGTTYFSLPGKQVRPIEAHVASGIDPVSSGSCSEVRPEPRKPNSRKSRHAVRRGQAANGSTRVVTSA